MKVFNINDIRSWEPCYDPGRYLSEDWSGTALDILNMEDVPLPDRLWVVLREECIDARTIRLFAVRCTRRALSRAKNPDPRSLNACDVAERHANGEATDEELKAAFAAALAAASDAAKGAAFAAAWAAWAAARAVSAAAWDAAFAADAAARAAWEAVRDAARRAAKAAEREAQREDLIELLNLK